MNTIKKRMLTVFVCMLVVVALVALVACDTHTHEYTEYGKSANQHWKLCPDDGKIDPDSYENHKYGEEGKCVCGAEKPADGDDHTHSYTAWGKNDTEHWKYCPDDNAEEAGSRASHAYTLDNNTKCVCGATTSAVTPDPDCKCDSCKDGCECKNCDGTNCTCHGTVTPEPDCKCEECKPDCDCKDCDGTDCKCHEEEHECEHPCPECGGCLTEDCEHDACKDKCTCPDEPCCDNPECDCEDCQGDCTCGQEVQLPNITEWDSVDDAIYGEVHENGSDYIWHHIFLNDAVAKEYDFDSFEATVTIDGVDGEVVQTNPMAAAAVAAHTYHLHIRIKGNRYQTTVFTIQFKKDGKTVATGTYTRVGDKEIVLDSVNLTISQDQSETVNILSVNGKTDLAGLKITWSIVDTEGTDVATIPANSNGASVEVTAVSVGKATLTCTIGEGDSAFSKTCVITVVEGEVQIVAVDLTEQVKFNNDFEGGRGKALQLRIELQDAKFAELVDQINLDNIVVTVTMDQKASTTNILQKYWQAPGVYNLYIQLDVESDWSHDYVFRISILNSKDIEIAYATYEQIAPKTLTLNPKTLNLTLKDGETVTGTVTATKTSKVEGDVVWSIEENGVASIVDNHDGTITVTALKKGTAIITATVDGLTQTCTVNVTEEGETPQKPESSFTLVFVEVYGDHYMHFSTTSDLPEGFSFDYVKVYKDDDTQGTQRWSEFANGHLRVYVTDPANAFDGEWKFEFYKNGEVVATVYFTYPVAP